MNGGKRIIESKMLMPAMTSAYMIREPAWALALVNWNRYRPTMPATTTAELSSPKRRITEQILDAVPIVKANVETVKSCYCLEKGFVNDDLGSVTSVKLRRQRN